MSILLLLDWLSYKPRAMRVAVACTFVLGVAFATEAQADPWLMLDPETTPDLGLDHRDDQVKRKPGTWGQDQFGNVYFECSPCDYHGARAAYPTTLDCKNRLCTIDCKWNRCFRDN